MQPTHTHRRGDRRGPRSAPFKDDMWFLESGLAETEALHRHIDSLWERVRPSSTFLTGLKQSAKVDVFLGYRSNCDHAGFEVPHPSLEMFRVLEIPFGVSVIIAGAGAPETGATARFT